jgi:dipeptidase D
MGEEPFMADVLSGLTPRSLWSHFAALAAIPRPSGSEERAAEFVIRVTEGAGAKVRRDARGNVVARVPATPGRERAPTVVLQTHLDIVAEKDKGVAHDFERDPIVPRLDGEWVAATGTTLGADNGIGVAAALAAATDPEVVHGPLELLFTLDEEASMTGGKELDAALISGRILLNLDSEEDGVIFIGCAGGEDTLIDLHPAWVDTPAGNALRLEVSGLKGGHSGLNIVENRGNALKLLARVLEDAIESGIVYELAGVAGGSKLNAIPRDAEATLVATPEGANAMRALAARALDAFRSELAGMDDGVRLTVADTAGPARVLARPDRDRLVRLMTALPHGVLGMSRDIPGLVETSSNLAVVAEMGDGVRVATSSRSSVAGALTGVLASVRAAARLAGGEVTRKDAYPGWKPNLESKALEVVRGVYRERWGAEPRVTAIHAGLECGLLAERVPGLDMVSFGPQIEGGHTPDERVHVPSVERFWGALNEVLKRLSA